MDSLLEKKYDTSRKIDKILTGYWKIDRQKYPYKKDVVERLIDKEIPIRKM